MRASRTNLEDQVGGLVSHPSPKARRRTGRLRRSSGANAATRGHDDQQTPSIRAQRAA